MFLSGENISCNEKIEDEGIEFLTKLRRIELEYDLIFQCPKDNAEYRKVDILNDLIENGYTTAFNAIQGSRLILLTKNNSSKLVFLRC